MYNTFIQTCKQVGVSFRQYFTALLKAVLDRYPDVRQIELVTDNTPKTVAFYKSLGFSELSEIGCCGFVRC